MSLGGGRRLLMLALCGSLALLFGALGVWQVERLAWKRDLIARVEARLAAAPVPVPPREAWPSLDLSDSEYRRVSVTGVFDWPRTTLVDALTERGPGNWIITPLLTDSGTILVNRGFAPKGWKPPIAATEEGPTTITGLLRLTEPQGRILRPNQPEADVWYSRDIAAIADARGLAGVAPFFIDQDARTNAATYPVGGLTVVRFPNNHLIYALTWFGLCALSLVGLVLVARTPIRRG